MGISKINLIRENQYADSLREYKVFLDNKEIGTISKGINKEFQINPGKHNIQLIIDWCSSNNVEFEVKNNETINIYCGSNLKGINLWLLSLLYITIWKNNYLYIRLNER